MQVIEVTVPGKREQLVIAPIGDMQWSGPNGPTAIHLLQRHLKANMAEGAWFIGMGDYIDFASPSNRARIQGAALYDTAQEVIAEAGMNLMKEIFFLALEPTVGRWLGLLEGHHYTQLLNGDTTDTELAVLLQTPFLGTSAIIRVTWTDSDEQKRFLTLYAHHGAGGGGLLPSGPLNKLYHTASGYEGIDVFLMGHTTKVPCTRLSRPYPVWGPDPDLRHRDVLLVNTGSFSKSGIVGHKFGNVPRGDYAEQRMLTPSPLSAPVLYARPAPQKGACIVQVLL